MGIEKRDIMEHAYARTAMNALYRETSIIRSRVIVKHTDLNEVLGSLGRALKSIAALEQEIAALKEDNEDLNKRLSTETT